MSTSTLTVAVATVSVYSVMFTLSGDNVHYQPLLSTFNEKAKIKKYDHNIFTNHFKFSSNEDSGHSGHPPSLINVLGGRIKKWMDAHRANIADGKNHNCNFYTF